MSTIANAKLVSLKDKINQNGLGFVWRPEDFEFLEAFTQANGFATADKALKADTKKGQKKKKITK